MFDCLLNVYVFNFNLTSQKIRLVSTKKDEFKPLFKHLVPEQGSIDSNIKELITDHLICNINNIKPRLFDLEVYKNIFNINYLVTTPVDLKLSNAYYIEVSNSLLLNPIISKAMLYV